MQAHTWLTRARPPRQLIPGGARLAVAFLALLLAGDALASQRLEARLTDLGFSRAPVNLPVPSERAGPTLMPQGLPTSPRPANASVQPTPAPTREEIAARVGFVPKAPAYLPTGYRPTAFEITVVDGVTTRRIGWRADPPPDARIGASALSLAQERATEPLAVPLRIGAASATEAVVGGGTGVWIERVPAGSYVWTYADGRRERGTLVANVLAWESGGVRYRLWGDASLDRGELTRVAESLG